MHYLDCLLTGSLDLGDLLFLRILWDLEVDGVFQSSCVKRSQGKLSLSAAYPSGRRADLWAQ